MSHSDQSQLTLISHKLCPYVQRAAIALDEQGIEYRRQDIDLASPPDWFLRLSPLGKVPLLLVGEDIVLFESAVIAEYVNELGGGRMLAADSIVKAQQRSWIEFASATLDNIGALYSAKDENGFEQIAQQLDGKWQSLEAALLDRGFFSGDEFSLVDAAFAPIFRYIDLFEHLLDHDFLSQYHRIGRWRQQLAQRDSVQNAVRHDYPTLLLQFLAERDSWIGRRASAVLANPFAA